MPEERESEQKYVNKNSQPNNFVNLQETIPTLLIDLAYATKHNFVGEKIDGYESNIALLTREATTALAKVQKELTNEGLGLKVLDAYRPQRSVDQFLAWAKNMEDTKTKQEFYPNLTKQELFDQGYLFERSSHSRGSTIDVTLVDLQSGLELDMGSAFDFFDSISWSDSKQISTQQNTNRLMLKQAMLKHGFLPIATEWWHFTLAKEPYPDIYFDFVAGVNS